MGLDLSVIIVNYNGARWLERCLHSLAEQAQGMAYEVIVVDNASQDDSLAWLAEHAPDARVIANTDNVGFSRANNQGFEIARGECFLLLNNDTVFLEGLSAMMTFLSEDAARGAVGPLMLDEAEAPRVSWGYFPRLWRVLATMLLVNRLPGIRERLTPLVVRPQHPRFLMTPHPVDWTEGACLLVKRSVWEKVGGLDPWYFMYGEDVEWCYRMWQAGFEVWVYPPARVIHYGAGGKEWMRNWKGEFATRQTFRGFLHFYRKHRPRWQMPFLRAGLFLGAGLRWLGGGWLCLRAAPEERIKARQVMRTYAGIMGWLIKGANG